MFRSCDLLACYWNLVAPTARSGSCEKLAGRVACIYDGLSTFLFEGTVGSVVDDFQVDGLAAVGAADD